MNVISLLCSRRIVARWRKKQDIRDARRDARVDDRCHWPWITIANVCGATASGASWDFRGELRKSVHAHIRHAKKRGFFLLLLSLDPYFLIVLLNFKFTHTLSAVWKHADFSVLYFKSEYFFKFTLEIFVHKRARAHVSVFLSGSISGCFIIYLQQSIIPYHWQRRLLVQGGPLSSFAW